MAIKSGKGQGKVREIYIEHFVATLTYRIFQDVLAAWGRSSCSDGAERAANDGWRPTVRLLRLLWIPGVSPQCCRSAAAELLMTRPRRSLFTTDAFARGRNFLRHAALLDRH